MHNSLAHLENESMGGTHATKATKRPEEGERVGFVGSVAYLWASFKKFRYGNANQKTRLWRCSCTCWRSKAYRMDAHEAVAQTKE